MASSSPDISKASKLERYNSYLRRVNNTKLLAASSKLLFRATLLIALVLIFFFTFSYPPPSDSPQQHVLHHHSFLSSTFYGAGSSWEKQVRRSATPSRPNGFSILVTGAAGFVGSHSSLALKKRGDGVLGLDNFNSYYDPSLKRARQSLLWKHKIFIVEADLNDEPLLSKLFDIVPFTHVLHLAAQAGVRYAMKNPQSYVNSNIAGFINLLEIAKMANPQPSIVWASSSSVYGLNTQNPFSESHRTDQPASLYAATKKAGEEIAHTYNHIYGLSITGLRFFTVYGPWGRPDMAYFFFTKDILQGKPINIYKTHDDKEVARDFTYIDDVVRGCVSALDTAEKSTGSAGNHAQGVALAAKNLNCDAVIAMPVTTPEIKWKSVERLGATVVLVGDSYDEAQAYAKKRSEEEGRTFIPPFDHPDIIVGQGTVGMEIMQQLKDDRPLHAIFVPVGGGGLIAGIAAYTKQVYPEVKIIGVEPNDANAMALSLHHGQRVMLEQVGGFADGVAVKVVGEETFRLCRELLDGVVLVSRDAICASIKDMFEETRSILEPAGALSLAGAEAYCKYYGLKDENVIAITSGANMNFDRLRLVTELANVGRQREAVLATYMPEEAGSFKLFAEMVGPMNITEFKYRYDGREKQALVLYSVGLHTVSELIAMVNRMESSQLRTENLTSDDLVKDHLRHLMGAMRSNVENERLYRFVFPERPGTLMKFLDAFSPRWNISLFHYRAQGDTGANVLVGIQVKTCEMDEFQVCAESLGYDYADETRNPTYNMFVR